MSTEMRAARPGAGVRPPRLRRDPSRGYAGGVCAGLGDYFAVEPLRFRIAFAVLTAFGGAGVVVYVLAWALVPAMSGSDAASATPALLRSARPAIRSLRGAAWREAAGIGLLVLAGLLLLRQLGWWPGDAVVWPAVLGSCGLALVARQAWGVGGWRLAPRPRRQRWAGGQDSAAGAPAGVAAEQAAPDDGSLPGGVLGAALIIGAALIFLQATGTFDALREAFLGIVVVIAVIALVFGPWMVRQGRALAAERSERIRSQERAEVAAHLHDSVLQTLALIQRRSADPRTVSTLARRQERELRSWLSGAAPQEPGASLAGALDAVGQEIEQLHGVEVEVVAVGDCPLDERLGALVQAAREALANAARFSGADEVDLYAEVDDDRVQVYVRDRGAGFDPDAVPGDRRGLRESVVGRMQRHGGQARIESTPGAGTEIELTMERRG